MDDTLVAYAALAKAVDAICVFIGKEPANVYGCTNYIDARICRTMLAVLEAGSEAVPPREMWIELFEKVRGFRKACPTGRYFLPCCGWYKKSVVGLAFIEWSLRLVSGPPRVGLWRSMQIAVWACWLVAELAMTAVTERYDQFVFERQISKLLGPDWLLEPAFTTRRQDPASV